MPAMISRVFHSDKTPLSCPLGSSAVPQLQHVLPQAIRQWVELLSV